VMALAVIVALRAAARVRRALATVHYRDVS
jgi:hypothetical protein